MSDDRRQMYRYPVQEGHTWAVIKIGRNESNVLLLDESAGGFSVASGPLPGVAQGTQFTLQTTHAGWYVVEVVHIQQEGEETRLGLRRVRELRPAGATTSAKEASTSKSQVANAPRVSRGTIGLFATAAVLFGLWLVLPASLYRGGEPSRRAEIDGGKLSKKVDRSTWTGVEIANSLTSPKVMKALKLSKDQERNISKVFDETSLALNELYKDSKSRSEHEIAKDTANIVELTLQRFLCTLTDKQIRQWTEMLARGNISPEPADQAAR